MTPKFLNRLRNKELSKDKQEIARLNALLDSQRAQHVTEAAVWLNKNNALWNALRALPGGLEAARRLDGAKA